VSGSRTISLVANVPNNRKVRMNAQEMAPGQVGERRRHSVRLAMDSALSVPKENEVPRAVAEKNKAFVLEAFETLYDKRNLGHGRCRVSADPRCLTRGLRDVAASWFPRECTVNSPVDRGMFKMVGPLHSASGPLR
jgi:hypothetical protein